MADFGEALGQDVEKEASEELDCGEAEGFEAIAVTVVLVSKSDGASLGIESAEAGVGDGDAVSVATQVIQDVLGTCHRALGKDHPALSLELAKQLSEGGGLAERLEVTLEAELAGGVKLEQTGAELGAEDPTDGVKGKEPASLVGSGPGVLSGQATASDQAVEVRMVHEVLAPGMKDGDEAQLGVEALLSEVEERRAGGVEEQAVEGLRVLQRQGAKPSREGEDPVEITDGQQGLALAFQPLAAVWVLAARTMAIAATVGSPMGAVTVLALPDRPAQLCGATPAEPTQHFEVGRGHRAGLEVLGQEDLQDPGQGELRRLAGGTAHRSSRSE